MRQICLTLAAIFCLALSAGAQTQPTTTINLPEGPLKITITGVEGLVQCRKAPEQPWQKAIVGMVLDEGAEFRTGPKSAVRFTIPPDQTITLDRLGTVQILKADIESGKIFTDLGMKYGRTRYDIENVQREHDGQLRSPSSVLAIRGTEVILDDQPPFAPQGTSLTGRAMFRDAKKQVSVGSAGGTKAKVDTKSDTPANFAMQQTVNDPHGDFSGRTSTEYTAQVLALSYAGTDYSNMGVLSLLDSTRSSTFTGTVIGALPIQNQLLFDLSWLGDPQGNVDISIISPKGEVVSIANPIVPSSGQHLGDARADDSGFGDEQVVWQVNHPPGKYTFKIDLKTGKTANADLVVLEDSSNPAGGAFAEFTPTLTTSSPSFTGTITTPIPKPPPGPGLNKSSKPIAKSDRPRSK